VHLAGFIIRIYHDAWSSEYQIHMEMFIHIPQTYGQGSRRVGYFLDETHNNKTRRTSLLWNDI